ncbi:MAG: hypothetical protein SP1CHLAM54_12500 [Chlamydiia bacterium]|nr:hypothetical protein [Chlamydiia bacterium]MCH9616148.1 hypothetical protein [Chlamydiia bacterium]MCH9629866.1 hypothetical protein [Chlamydiia bacterium]
MALSPFECTNLFEGQAFRQVFKDKVYADYDAHGELVPDDEAEGLAALVKEIAAGTFSSRSSFSRNFQRIKKVTFLKHSVTHHAQGGP